MPPPLQLSLTLPMNDRRARLAALAARAGRSKPAATDAAEDDTADAYNDTPASDKPTLKFRNYTPSNSASIEPVTKRARQEEGQEESEKKSSALEHALEKAHKETTTSSAPLIVAQVEDIGDVAPKKINWDLKRDVQPKLDKLERRTQKAIIESLKERLEREASVADDEVD